MGQPLNDPTIEDPSVDDPNLIEDEGEDEDGGEDGGDAYVPPSKEQWDAQQRELKRARRQAEAARKGKDSEKDPAKDGEGPTKWEMRTARSEAKQALIAAGVDADVAALAAQGIRPDQIHWDDDDDADVSEWIDRLREKRPGIFKATGNRGGGRPPAKLNRGQGGAGKPDDKLSFGELVRKRSKAGN